MDDFAADKLAKFERDLRDLRELADYWQLEPPKKSQVRVVRALLRAALRLPGGDR